MCILCWRTRDTCVRGRDAGIRRHGFEDPALRGRVDLVDGGVFHAARERQVPGGRGCADVQQPVSERHAPGKRLVDEGVAWKRPDHPGSRARLVRAVVPGGHWAEHGSIPRERTNPHPVEVLGEHAATGIDISLHQVHRSRVWNEDLTRRRGGILFGAATVEQDHVVLVQIGLFVPKTRCRVRECPRDPRYCVARVRVLRLIVQPDRTRAGGQGKLRCIDAYPTKQALQALGGGQVGTLSIASRYGDLGHAGVLPVVVPVVDVLGQTQQGRWRGACPGICNRIVCTLLGDHRSRDGDLTTPLAELHDQWERRAPRHVADDKVPLGIGHRGGDGLA